MPTHHSGDAARITRTLTDTADVDYGMLVRFAADVDHGMLIWLAADALAIFMKPPNPAANDMALRALHERYRAGRKMCRARVGATTPQPDDDHHDGVDVGVEDGSYDRPDLPSADGGLQGARVELTPGLEVITRAPDAIDNVNELLSSIYSVATEFARRVWEQVRPLTADEWRVLGAFFHQGNLLIGPREPPTPTPDPLPTEHGDAGRTRPDEP